jgi:type II secretory pathway pseudopilin PulG
MKRAFTMLELILSILIISSVFVVIPKILSILDRSDSLRIKEEALFAAVTMAGHIRALAWDQHTIEREGAILSTGGIECNSTTGPHGEGYYRVGGFVGSRNCIGWRDTNEWKPTDSVDIDNGYDDIDDYDGYGKRIESARGGYDLNISVNRDGDIKKVHLSIKSIDKKRGVFKSGITFESANLGWVRINGSVW